MEFVVRVEKTFIARNIVEDPADEARYFVSDNACGLDRLDALTIRARHISRAQSSTPSPILAPAPRTPVDTDTAPRSDSAS